MRTINLLVYHCTATEAGKEYTVEDITKWHKARGFRTIGYHFLVHLDGAIDIGRKIAEMGAHAKGYNRHSIGISYVGGIKHGEPHDTRTTAQVHALRAIDKILKSMFPDAKSVGHRDLSVDLNGDGVISKKEWMKSCPSFSVKTQL